MAIDYNRLMKELDSCLGLESSATESVKRPSGPSKKRKAFEGYDDVDMEIIQAMKDSPEGASSEFSEEDLVYSDDNQDMPEADEEESPEVKLADSVDCLFNDYVQSGKTPQEAADSIKDLVESAVAELYDPDDEEAEADEGMNDVVTPVKRVSCHSLANRSSTESLIGYDDPRFQTLEDIVVRKILKSPLNKEYKDELIEDIRINGIEEYMGYFDENADKVEEDLKDKASMNRAADAYVKFLVDDHNESNRSSTESLIGYDDPRFQTLEDIVVRKILKSPLNKEYKDELIEDIRINGIEEYMGYFDENADKVEEDLKDKASMNRAADAYVKFLVDDHNESNRSSTESNNGKSPSPEEIKVINYIKKAFGDLYNSGIYGSWEDLLGNESDEFREYGLDDEESIADYAETKRLGVPFKTKSQVMTLGKNIDKAYDIVQKYGEGVFSSGSSATEASFGYYDPCFRTLENMVIKKLRKAPIDKKYRDGLIADIIHKGMEKDWMGYLDETMNKAADAYVKDKVDRYNKSRGSADGANSGIVEDDPYDPDAAFEALSSKMLNRYSQLTHRSRLKNKKSAEEGVSASEVKIDDDVIRRVSCEFAYSGKNLRKMVAEAIKKGVI